MTRKRLRLPRLSSRCSARLVRRLSSSVCVRLRVDSIASTGSLPPGLAVLAPVRAWVVWRARRPDEAKVAKVWAVTTESKKAGNGGIPAKLGNRGEQDAEGPTCSCLAPSGSSGGGQFFHRLLFSFSTVLRDHPCPAAAADMQNRRISSARRALYVATTRYRPAPPEHGMCGGEKGRGVRVPLVHPRRRVSPRSREQPTAAIWRFVSFGAAWLGPPRGR